MTSQTQSSQMGFAEKFGLRYYAFIINVLVFTGIFQLTHSSQVVMLMVVLVPYLGNYLPKDNQQKIPNSNEINKNIHHMFAPVAYTLGVYFMIYYVWINYQIINHSYQSLFSTIFALTYTIGQSIDGSHNLIHRNQFILRAIGFIGLIPFQFTTYPIEHLYMHHKLVGTPQDAVTAPKNMTIYQYYFRTLFSSYKETFKYSKIFFLFCMLLNFSYLLILYIVAYNYYENAIQALRKVSFFVLLAYYSLFVMECVQYIEHYGLIYRKDSTQKPVLQVCSWNTVVNPVYNMITFRFQRHSDHHMNAYKIYSTLELNDKMPQFPFTFPQGLSASWFPPLWFKIANPLVDRVLKNEKPTQSEIKSSKLLVQIVTYALTIAFTMNAYIGYQNISIQV